MSEFHNPHVKRKAMKQHRCDWCGQFIEKGDEYIAASGRYEGDFYSNRMHPECSKAQKDEGIATGDWSFFTHENERPEVKS